jgi:YidC/Oxa1 family membrane protein insertase
MEMRLLLAFLLMCAVLFLTPYLFKQPPAPKSTPPVTPQKAAEVAKPPKPAPSPVETPTAPPPAGEVQASKVEIITIDTPLYKVVLSNEGAVVRSWVLKGYKDLKGNPQELVDLHALGSVPAPLSLGLKDSKLETEVNQALYVAKRTPDGMGIDYEYSNGKVTVRKSFRFAKDSYRTDVTTEVDTANGTVPHTIDWRGGFGDETVRNASGVEKALYYDSSASKVETKTAKDAKNGPVTFSGDYPFLGLEDNYFASIFLPQSDKTPQLTVYSDQVKVPPDNKSEAFVGAGVGGEGINKFSLFVGPKDTDILRKVDPKLVYVIDWGWFGFLAKPLFVVLDWTHDHVVTNFGWVIILVTVALNMIMLPFKFTSLKSSKKMQALQPQIAAINAKYKGMSLRDPRQTEKNQEMMDLYKKYGVNPLGGCLPMALQIPFFFAFYKVLTVALELRGAHFLWVSDLSRPEDLPIRILPVILIITQFISQKMTPPSPGVDPSQQKMMMFMPLVLGFMFYYESAGLVLYWLTSNLVGIGQQWLTNRTVSMPVIDVKPVNKKKGPKT